mgnify:CR=1 FL=1
MLDIRPNTPIEEYELNGHPVFVKRDDMMGDGITLPQWAKLEAIQTIFESTTPLGIPLIDKSKPVSYMCNRASWSGWALSKIGTELGYDVKIGYPNFERMFSLKQNYIAALVKIISPKVVNSKTPFPSLLSVFLSIRLSKIEVESSPL